MSIKRPRDLSERELDFYSRQIVLTNVGYNGQLGLKNAKACLVGLGGLGSPAAMLLAAMGVGQLRLVDRDVVEFSNLQRQHLYGIRLLGYPKVEAAARRLKDLNPHIKIEPLPYSLNEDNAEDILRGVDVVVDGLDHMRPRYAINRACVKLKIPYIFGAAIATHGHVSTILPGETPCLECFQGNLDDETLPTCAVVGVHPSILGIIASIEVAEAVKILLGERPRLANKLLYCDIEYMDFQEVRLSQSENCPVCGPKASTSPAPLKRDLIEEVCGRGGRRVFIITPRRDLDLDIKKLYEVLKKKNFNIEVKANLGITFSQNCKRASVLKSGILITEGVKDREETLEIFNEVVLEGLGIPRSYAD